MRSRAIRVLMLAVLALYSASASCEVYSGRDLLRACTEPKDVLESNACQGWIDWGFSSPHFCIPATVDDKKLRKVLVDWLRQHNNKLHMPGGALMQNAFYAAYPCARFKSDSAP